jgi:hypothetical protein
MANRRKSGDYDWEAELAARQQSSAPNRPRRSWWKQLRIWRARLPRRVRRALDIVAGVLAASGASGLLVNPSRSTLLAVGLILTGLALAVLLSPFKRRDAFATALETALKKATRGDPLIQLFYVMGHQGTYFRVRPPSADAYERWLESAGGQIARYSSALAAEWAQPEQGRVSPLDRPSPEAVLERLDRITEMHDRIAKDGISLDELAAAGFPGACDALSARGDLSDALA